MTDRRKIIRGSKGGGGQPAPPPQPTRTPDTLHSKQFATFLDLISEGEIEGSASASKEGITDKNSAAYRNAYLKDVFLNNTPILQASASSSSPAENDFNFQNVTFNSRFGTADQPKIDGIEGSSSVTPVGVTVTQSSPVTRQVVNTDVDRVKLTITFPQIQIATDTGDLLGDTVEFKISVQYNSGGFTDVHTDTVTGRTADTYQKDFSIKITGSFPVDIRVTRITEDSTTSSTINSFQWTSLTEIIDDASTYANSAYNSIRLDSQQFSSIPSRKFRIRGIKVRIPGAGASSSGTPTVDLQTGRIQYPTGYIFNGVMGAAVWTSCPAMILLDLLTNTRYGFGDHITDSNLDLFSFVTASKYANTLVDNGLGGQEARFSCNVNIQSSAEAFDLINELAGVMRCMPIFSAGTITITQDSPKDASYLFNLSNVTPEGFSYSGSSLKQRHTAVAVSYFNMDSQDVDFEVVEDSTAQSKFGIITKQVKAFACTSRGQAARLGRAILFAEQNESEIVSFSTSIDAGVVVRPGAIIDINDPVRAGVRRGGKLSAVASTTVMTIDDANASDLATTNSPKFSVVLPNGTVETKDVSSISSAGVVTVSSAFSQTPNVNTVWLLSNTTVEPQKFRVISVEEQDGINYLITALSYAPGKYAFIEDGTALPDRSVSLLNELTPPPSNLSTAETIVPINNQAVSKIIISWQPIVGVIEYQVNYRYNNGNFVSEKVSRPDFEILNSQLGTYEIQVFSYNIQGQLSATSNDLNFIAVGKTALPEDPTGLTSEPVSELFIRLRFNPATDIDVTHGGAISVRHTTDTTGAATFANSVEIIPKLSGNISETLVPALTGTYSIKFIDDGGRRSANAAKIIVTKPDAQPNQIITTKREDQTSPPFNGTRLRTVFSDEFSGLVIDGTELFDNVDNVGASPTDGIPNFDFLTGGIAQQGFYTFVDDLDLGAVFNLSLERHFKTAAIIVSDLWDFRLTLVDDMPDWDGTLAEEVGAKLQVATCQGVPTSSQASTYSQSQDLITITRSSHGMSVNDQVLVDFTNGTASDGFLKVTSVTNANIFVAEAVRTIAEYAITNPATGEIRFFTEGNHGGLAVGDTVKLVTLTGKLISGNYVVGNTFPFNTVSITTTANNLVTEGSLEFIKIKDSSGNNVTTSGNCNISSAFSPFNIFANGEYSARGFRFRAELFSNDPDQNIEIDELGYTASMKRRTETVNTAIASNCATSSSAKTVTFGNSFFTGTSAINSSTTAFLPTIGITLEGAVSGDYFKITSVTGTQFVIETRDGSNNFKDLNFKYTAIGFGKGV
tara:strand:+ start:1849 stop:5748 length:3900 start_codon:yes stop_codon:yes gene_type:complete